MNGDKIEVDGHEREAVGDRMLELMTCMVSGALIASGMAFGRSRITFGAIEVHGVVEMTGECRRGDGNGFGGVGSRSIQRAASKSVSRVYGREG